MLHDVSCNGMLQDLTANRCSTIIIKIMVEQMLVKLQSIVYIGYVDYVMAKRENLSKLNLSLLKTLTLKEELVKKTVGHQGRS